MFLNLSNVVCFLYRFSQAVVPVGAGSDTENGVTVIREIYENGLATEYFAMQLDYALDSGIGTIIIEPSRLGRETSHWLTVGNVLRRSALMTGSLSLATRLAGRDSVSLALGAVASALSVVHIVSWRPDPCSRYRVERSKRRLQQLPLNGVSCSGPVVLVKCNHGTLRNCLTDTVSLATLATCCWQLYKNCSG